MIKTLAGFTPAGALFSSNITGNSTWNAIHIACKSSQKDPKTLQHTMPEQQAVSASYRKVRGSY